MEREGQWIEQPVNLEKAVSHDFNLSKIKSYNDESY